MARAKVKKEKVSDGKNNSEQNEFQSLYSTQQGLKQPVTKRRGRMARKESGSKRLGELIKARKELKALVSHHAGSGTSEIVKTELDVIIRRLESDIVDLLEQGEAVSEKKVQKKTVVPTAAAGGKAAAK